MTLRIWLALLLAPITGAVLYGLLGYLTWPGALAADEVPVLNMAVLGGFAALIYELVILIPLHLLLRRRPRRGATLFVLAGTVLWFVLSTTIMALSPGGLFSALVNGIQMVPVGFGTSVVFAALVGRSERH